MTLPKTRSNANYISLSYTAAAAACKSRVVIPLELPARKKRVPSLWTRCYNCTSAHRGHMEALFGKRLFRVTGIGRKQQRGGGRKPITQDSHVPMSFLTGTMCSITILAAADGSSDFALRPRYSHGEVLFCFPLCWKQHLHEYINMWCMLSAQLQNTAVRKRLRKHLITVALQVSQDMSHLFI